jgi:ribonucleotide monophosphatase NagD (HAD superfamily)
MSATAKTMTQATKRESLPKRLKKLAIVFQKVKHLDEDTIRFYLANPDLVLNNIDKFNVGNIPTQDSNRPDKFPI